MIKGILRSKFKAEKPANEPPKEMSAGDRPSDAQAPALSPERAIRRRESYIDNAKTIEEAVAMKKSLGSWKTHFELDPGPTDMIWWGAVASNPVPFNLFDDCMLVKCGGRHFVALTYDGQFYSWGYGKSGQLGHGSRDSEDKPRLLESLSRLHIAQVEAGAAQSAAITQDGQLYVWGFLGTKEYCQPMLVEHFADMQVLQVSLGLSHVLALVEDASGSSRVYSWGSGSHGELGLGSLDIREQPDIISDLSNLPIKQVYAGDNCSAALTDDGKLLLWGKNRDQLLGVNSTHECISTPYAVPGLLGKRVVAFSFGVRCCAAVTDEGDLYTWGAGDKGQLGHSGTSNEMHPRQVLSLRHLQLVGVGCGNGHMIGWTDDGQTYTWGSNLDNRLGLGVNDLIVEVPTLIQSLKGRAVFWVSCGAKSVVAAVGVNLENQLEISPPLIVTRCAEALRSHLQVPRLFQDAADELKLQCVARWWNIGYFVDMNRCPELHIIAQLLRLYIRSQSQPLINQRIFSQLVALQQNHMNIVHYVEGLRVLVNQIPEFSREILRAFLLLLRDVSQLKHENEMSPRALATAVLPSLVWEPEEDAMQRKIRIDLLTGLIKYSDAIFHSDSVSMLTSLSECLVCGKRERMRKMQMKLWYECMHLKEENEKSFVFIDGTPATFREVVMFSRMIENSVESALMHFPEKIVLYQLQQVLSLLSGVDPAQIVLVIQAVAQCNPRPAERQTCACFVAAYKDFYSASNRFNPPTLQDNTQKAKRGIWMYDTIIDTRQRMLAAEQELINLERIRRSKMWQLRALAEFKEGLIDERIIGEENKARSQLEQLEYDRQATESVNPALEAKRKLEELQKTAAMIKQQLQARQSSQQSSDDQVEQINKQREERRQAALQRIERLTGNAEEVKSKHAEHQKAYLIVSSWIDEVFAPHNNLYVSRVAESKQAIASSQEKTLYCYLEYLNFAYELLHDLRSKTRRIKKYVRGLTKDGVPSDAVKVIEKNYEDHVSLLSKVELDLIAKTNEWVPVRRRLLVLGSDEDGLAKLEPDQTTGDIAKTLLKWIKVETERVNNSVSYPNPSQRPVVRHTPSHTSDLVIPDRKRSMSSVDRSSPSPKPEKKEHRKSKKDKK